MDSTRQKKISRLIQKELAVIFQHEIELFSQNVIISVNTVRVSSDLSNAKVFMGIFPCKNPDECLHIIENKKNMIRKKLGYNVRNQLRAVPQLQFYLDDSAAYADNIDQLLNK